MYSVSKEQIRHVLTDRTSTFISLRELRCNACRRVYLYQVPAEAVRFETLSQSRVRNQSRAYWPRENTPYLSPR